MIKEYIPAYVISNCIVSEYPDNAYYNLSFNPKVLAYVPSYKEEIVLDMETPILSNPYDRIKFLGLKPGDNIICSCDQVDEEHAVWTLYDFPIYNVLKQQYTDKAKKLKRNKNQLYYVLASALIADKQHRGIEFIRNVLAYNPEKKEEVVLEEPFYMRPEEKMKFYGLNRGDEILCTTKEKGLEVIQYVSLDKRISEYKAHVRNS